jgi:hypothetical protein
MKNQLILLLEVVVSLITVGVETSVLVLSLVEEINHT